MKILICVLLLLHICVANGNPLDGIYTGNFDQGYDEESYFVTFRLNIKKSHNISFRGKALRFEPTYDDTYSISRTRLTLKGKIRNAKLHIDQSGIYYSAHIHFKLSDGARVSGIIVEYKQYFNQDNESLYLVVSPFATMTLSSSVFFGQLRHKKP